MTALITGASQGIGKAAAIQFSKAGYNVVIGYSSSEEEALKLSEMLPNSIALCADVSDRKQVDEMFAAAKQEFGDIDVVICNAAISQFGLFSDVTQEDWQRMIAVNLTGVFNTAQSALSDMIRRKYGRIITVSSIWGMVGASCEVAYSAAKAGVIGLTKALAKELAPSGITVNCVAPGVIDTNMNNRLCEADACSLREEIPLGRFGTADEVAKTMLWLAGENAGYLTGQVISPNGGMVI